MTQIHVLDHQTDEILDTLNNEGINPFWDDNHRETLNNEEIFDFVTSKNNRATQYLNKRNRIIIPTDGGFFREFIIDYSDIVNENVEIKTLASYVELKKVKPIAPVTLEGQTVNTGMDYILAGTGWQRGITDYMGTRKIIFEDYINPYSAINQISNVDTFDMELRFRIETDGNKVTRYVDMIEKQGEWNGKEIVSGKDLVGMKRTESTGDIVTALIGIGPDKEDGTAPIIVEVVNEEARQAWGRDGKHLWGVYQPDSTNQDMTIEELTNLVENELQKRITSVVQYEVDGATLETILGREHEKVSLGDQARIKATEYNPPIYLDSRVIAKEGPITDRSKKKYTLGEFIEYSRHDVNALKNLLQKQIAKKISEGRLTEVTYTKQQVDDKDIVVKNDAATDAQQKASVAQQAAEEYALAKAQLAETQAKAYADGEVSAEEQARIDADTAKLAEAKLHAETKAQEAEDAANTYTNSQLTNYVGTTAYDNDLATLQAQIDNQITSHFKDYAPSLTNLPASDWTTNAEKDKHIGDLFYNSSTGYSYRFMLDNTVYKWTLVRDEGIAKALQDASQAQDTADSKRRVFVSQPTTPYDTGDLWANGNTVYRSTVTKTTSATFSSADWTKIGDVTSQNTSADTTKVGGRSASDIEDKQGAQNKADTAESQAKSHADAVALAKANLAETEAKAYADGIVSMEEQARINEAAAKLAEAKTYAETQVDAIEIGGRNLALNSNFSQGKEHWNWSGDSTLDLTGGIGGSSCLRLDGSTTTSYARHEIFFPNKSNEKYIAQVKVKTENIVYDGADTKVWFYVIYRSDAVGYNDKIIEISEGTNDWLTLTIELPPNLNLNEIELLGYGVGFTGFLWFDDWKIERGTKATDWTPAPEDVQAYADTVSEAAYLDAVADAEAYADDNATMLGQNYNGTSITNTDGILTVRGDQLVRVVQNATQGILIQRRAITTDPWVDVFYVDANGNVKFAGNLEGATGTFNGSIGAQILKIGNPNQDALGESGIQLVAMRPIAGGGGFVYDTDYHIRTDVFGRIIIENGQGDPALFIDGSITANIIYAPIYTEDWTVATLQNGWTNNGSPYGPARFKKDAMGWVTLEGLIKDGSTGAYVAALTLPPGYRPQYRKIFDSSLGTRVDVGTNGVVSCYTGSLASLEDIRFEAVN
jgi:phage minor structural protein